MSKVPASNYVAHFDRDKAHHRAWLQAALERLDEVDPKALERDGELHSIWASAVPSKPANPYQMIEPLLALIRQGESSNNYDAANTGQAGGRAWQGLQAMTLAEIMDAQAKGRLFAAGAYQITPAPMKQLAQRAGLPLTMPFSRETQDWLAVVLVLGGWKRPKLASYLLGKAATLREAHEDLAYEWACLQGPDGKGMYDGDSGGNQARIKAAQVSGALMHCRELIGGRTVQELGLKPPGAVPPKPPAPPAAAPPSAPKVDPGMPKGAEEAGMIGPKIKAPVKPGDFYLLVNDRDQDMEAYDHTGKLLWKAPALAKGQSSDPRVHRGDTPPGLYKLGQLYADYEQDPSARKTDERQSYGWFSFDMIELEDQERKVGRAGIMLHGGGSACGWPGAWAAKQKLHPTLGCIRMHNIDLRDKVLPLYRKSGTVYVGVYQ
jgi:hypothetical protein